MFPPKLKALVYDILLSIIAVFSYAMGSRKMSVNEQFFISARTIVSLLQSTEILLLLSWCLMSSDVIWHIRDKLWPMPKHGSIRKVYACLAVTCHLHFWQNDRDFLRATVVTRGWNGYRNKSQHRKSTLEKKILPPFQQGFEPATFQSRVRCSNHWAIPAPHWNKTRRVFYSRQQSLHQHKQNHNRLNRDGTSSFFFFSFFFPSFFLPGVDASRVYVRAWALGCFYSHISTRTFRRTLTVSVDSCAEIKVECPCCGTFCHYGTFCH